jgi:putative membrane protein
MFSFIFKKVVVGLLLNALCLYILIRLVPEITYTGGVWFFVLGGIVIGILNGVFKPLLKLVTLPIIFLSGGLFLIIINGFLLWFFSYFLQIANFRDIGISFPNFGSYVIGAIVFGLINFVESLII